MIGTGLITKAAVCEYSPISIHNSSPKASREHIDNLLLGCSFVIELIALEKSQYQNVIQDNLAADIFSTCISPNTIGAATWISPLENINATNGCRRLGSPVRRLHSFGKVELDRMRQVVRPLVGYDKYRKVTISLGWWEVLVQIGVKKEARRGRRRLLKNIYMIEKRMEVALKREVAYGTFEWGEILVDVNARKSRVCIVERLDCLHVVGDPVRIATGGRSEWCQMREIIYI